MGVLVGALLALMVGLMATATGLDRNRAFYPIATIVIASFYALFAAMSSSTRTLIIETLIGATFLVAAVVGFRSSLWIVVAALAAHGILDLAHERIVNNPGVPSWWAQFCLSYDLVAAAYLAWLLGRGRIRASA